MAAIVVSFGQTWESGFGRSSKIEAGKRGMVVWVFCGEGKEVFSFQLSVVSCQLSVFSFQFSESRIGVCSDSREPWTAGRGP